MDKAYSSKETRPLSSSEKRVRWIEDQNFKKTQIEYNVPLDPLQWDTNHVKHWIQWAVQTFNLTSIVLSDWVLSGEEICNMSFEDYKKKVLIDIDSRFWIHLQILRMYKQVTIQENEALEECTLVEGVANKTSKSNTNLKQRNELWQFLLELLTDKAYYDIIRWINDDGEFCIVQPETVAQLWGSKKGKQNMTYEKLSRGLRYYYNGEILCKVPGKRFAYKFLCNIKEVVGYSPIELCEHMMAFDQIGSHN